MGKPSCPFGNPCDAGTGNKFQHETDYSGAGVFPLRAERYYNSGADTPFVVESTAWGAQWRSYYDRSVSYSSNSTITTAAIRREDGKQYFFNLTNGAWVSDADVVGVLNRIGVDANGNPTGWTYLNEHDETEVFDATGKLTSITNRHGLTQTLTWSDGTAGPNGGYVVDASGILTTTVLPPGQLIRVSDPVGRTLQFGIDAQGHVVKMTDPAGGVFLYVYDGGNGNLISVTYPDSTVKTYLYAETANVSATPNAGVSYAHNLTGIKDGNGNRFASWTYDSAARATSSEHGASGSGIERVTLAYGAPDASGNRTTSVLDERGVTRNYNFSTIQGAVKHTGISGVGGLAPIPCNGCSVAVGRDANGNVASHTDFMGNTTCYTFDLVRNLPTVVLQGLAPVPGTTTPTACPSNLSTYAPSTATGSVERKITTQWHGNFRLPLAIAGPLRIITYTYDANGNVLSKTIQPTTDATGGAGFSATAAGTARTWTYTYNSLGQVLTADGPRTDVADITTYTYDAQGNLTSVKNALNQTTTLGGYNAHGRVGSITDPNGLVTTLAYDLRGRLTSRSRGGETTAYTYDSAGNLTGVALPSGAIYTYVYDQAHRLTQIADSLGNRIVYTLDNAGNRTQEQVLNSANAVVVTHSRVFDTLNHLVQDIGAVNQATVYTYDANGNVLTVTDPLNRLTTNAYDALDRLNQVTNPDNGVIKYAYDELDQLTKVTDPRNLVTQYTRDGLGNLAQVQSPDTGATAATYNAAGQVLTRTDAKGQTATYTYDILNRVTGITYTGGTAAPLTVAYQYDQGTNGIGRLTQVTDSTGTITYAYDQKGRLTSETQNAYGSTYTTGYAYDAQGRLASVSYPSGRTVNYTFDSQGHISGITTTRGATTTAVASAITYEPFGGVHSFNYGDGTTAPVQTYTRQRDQDGRIASYTLNASRTMSILYDAASQITTLSDSTNLANPASYTYDPMSRLTGYTQGAANQGFSYDQDGNRVSQTIGTATTTYTLGNTSNWLTGIQTGTGTPQTVAHDPNGATTLDASKSNQYAYDLRGRLIQTTTAQGAVNYEVNGLGLRVRKQVPYASTDTLYHYDTQGHLIAENPNGSPQYREYIYLGDQPIAVLQ